MGSCEELGFGRCVAIEYELFCELGRGAAVRQRGGGSGFLGGQSPGLALDGVGGVGEQRGVGVGDDHLADGSEDAVADQAFGAVAVSELSEHDQAVVERTDGGGVEGKMTRMKTEQRTRELGVRSQELEWADKAVRAPMRGESAFTLVELLVVIAIIGLLAALVVGGASYAKTAKTKSRVQAERAALETAIDSYYKAKGFYPPASSNDTVQTPLFYELTGTVQDPKTQKFIGMDQQSFDSATLSSLFGVAGFINCSNSETPSKNFFGGGLKNSQYQLVKSSSVNANYTVLGISVDGPLVLQAATAGGSSINPWHYMSVNPTNNHDSYDLWMDVKYAGKSNRISNWSPEPQLIN